MKKLILLCFLSLSCFAFSHEDHRKHVTPLESNQTNAENAMQRGRPTTWLQWIGSFHLIFLHFPIALINMLAISELLLRWFKRSNYEYVSLFLIASAAILTPLTALLGLIYSFSTTYEGLMRTLLFWHMWFGISTAVLALATAFIRKQFGKTPSYFFCLVLLILMVNITGFFGGGMTFGPYQMLPPFNRSS